ncbi:MAG: Smr/MutS family protein [Bacteroidetes bacterium]|nr:Smr/MutS family protein [Bacteroidota bacterium]
MIYPGNFENKIGFDAIRQLIKSYCLSEMGMTHVDAIQFSSKKEDIEILLCQTEEFRQICLIEEEKIPTSYFYDLRDSLKKIVVPGTFLETEQLFLLKSSLSTIKICVDFLNKGEEIKYPYLKEISENIYVDKAIIKRIEEIIDDKGIIKDSASPELSIIRKGLISKQIFVTKKLNNILRNARTEGWTPDNLELTFRNGRLVIPMLAAHKRKLKGFVHDESATGQTVYVEPAEIFEANNDIRELINAEKREIYKILLAFSDFIRPFIDELIESYNFLSLIDFIRAKAKFALSLMAFKPVLLDIQIIDWSKACHPLLYLSCKLNKKPIEPLDIKLDKKDRILIISGPNAGGKSVCLKTIGLLQYMMQCGLLVPMKEHSEMGIFDNVFIDIGDEQSLENDLSTYSSHLLSMKRFVDKANAKTLFLIDEFGAGTEPQLGGAIAESILEKLNDQKAFGVITTHYANLKLLADVSEGIMNGAMLFDSENMKPLYKLKMGKPGSSFAFEIAKKIGLQKEILEAASKKVGVKQLNFDIQLQDLETQKLMIENKQKELESADSTLAEMIGRYQSLNYEIEQSKKTIISEARAEATQLLEDANKQIEKTIRLIKESQAEKEPTKEIRKNFASFVDDVKIKTEEFTPESKESKSEKKEKKRLPQILPPEILTTPILKGDSVRIIGQTTIGDVISVEKNEAVVLFGSLHMKCSIGKLEKISKSKAKEQNKSNNAQLLRKINFDINKKLSDFKTSIDIRGKRAEEVHSLIQQYIDDAILLNIPQVNILHGKGNGVLRSIVRDYLKIIEEVKSFKDEEIEMGGNGITVVNFRNK